MQSSAGKLGLAQKLTNGHGVGVGLGVGVAVGLGDGLGEGV